MEVIDLVAKIGTDTSAVAKGMQEFTNSIGKAETDFNRAMTSMQKNADATTRSIKSMHQSLKQTMNFRAQDVMKVNTAGFANIANSIKDLKSTMTSVNSISRNLGENINAAGNYSEGFFRKWWEISKNVFNVMMTFRAIGGIIQQLLGPGFAFVKQMEQMELGTAGILMSMTQLNGRDLTWEEGLATSKKLMGDIANDALVTLSTTEELAKTFQSVLAPAMSAGFNIDQVREFAKVGSNAVRAIGLPAQQQVQELRALVNGGIRASVDTLAASLGVTNELWKKWRDEGTLFDNLMERMAGMSRAAKETQNSFMGLLSNIQDGIQRVTALGFTDVFDGVKESLRDIQALFFDIVPVMGLVNGKMVEISQKAVFNNRTLELFKTISKEIQLAWIRLNQVITNHQGELYALLGVFQSLYAHADKIGQLITLWFATQNKWTAILVLLENLGLVESILKVIAENIEMVITLIEIKMVASFVSMGLTAVAQSAIAGGAIGTLCIAMEILNSNVLATGTKLKLVLAYIAETFVPGAVAGFTTISSAVKSLITVLIGLKFALIPILAVLGAVIAGAWKAAQNANDLIQNGGEYVDPESGEVHRFEKPKKKEDAAEDAYDLLVRSRNEAKDKANNYMWYGSPDYDAEKNRKLTPKYPPGDEGKGGGAADRAANTEVKAALDAYLENLKLFQKNLDFLKQENLVSISDYWEETSRITRQGIEARIAAEEQLLTHAKDEAEAIRIQGNIKKLNTQLEENEVDTKRKLTKSLRDFGKEMNKVNEEYVKLVGYSAAIAAGIDVKKIFNDKAVEQYRSQLTQVNTELAAIEKRTKNGTSKEGDAGNKAKLTQQQAMIQALIDAATKTGLLTVATEQFDNELTRKKILLDEIDLKVKTGEMSEQQGITARKRLMEDQVNILRDKLNWLNLNANATEKDKLLIEQTALELQKLKAQVRDVGVISRSFMETQMTNAFMGIVNGTSSVTDAFKNMANAIISELIRVLVVQRLVGGLLKMMGFSGGGSVSPHGKAWGGVVKKADGGPMGEVRGPGTSTSDSIPAWLSNGEYVIRAAAVQKMGIAKLDFLNKYGYLPTAKYASGGFASSNKKGASSSVGGGKSGGVDLENIRFEIINQTKEEVRMEQPKVAMDGTTMVISAFLTGLRNNTMGVRDVLTSSAGGRR